MSDEDTPTRIPPHYPDRREAAEIREGLLAPEKDQPQREELRVPADLQMLMVSAETHKRHYGLNQPPGPDYKAQLEEWLGQLSAWEPTTQVDYLTHRIRRILGHASHHLRYPTIADNDLIDELVGRGYAVRKIV